MLPWNFLCKIILVEVLLEFRYMGEYGMLQYVVISFVVPHAC